MEKSEEPPKPDTLNFDNIKGLWLKQINEKIYASRKQQIGGSFKDRTTWDQQNQTRWNR